MGRLEEKGVRGRKLSCWVREDTEWRWVPEEVGREWIGSTVGLRKEDESGSPCGQTEV